MSEFDLHASIERRLAEAERFNYIVTCLECGWQYGLVHDSDIGRAMSGHNLATEPSHSDFKTVFEH